MKYKIAEYKQSSLSFYCPYLQLLDNSVFDEEEKLSFFKDALLQNKDGSLTVVFKFNPPITNNSEAFEERCISTMSEALSHFSSRYTIHFETAYVKPLSYYKDDSDNMLPFSAKLEKIRIEGNKKSSCYIRENYISINYQITSSKSEKSEEENYIDTFYTSLRTFLSVLSPDGFKLEVQRGDALMSYLHYTLTLDTNKYKTHIESGTGGLDELLCTSPLNPSTYPLRLGNKYIAVISVDNIIQKNTEAENLSPLFSLGIPLRLVSRFKCLSIEESQKIIEKKRDRYNNKIFDIGKSVFSAIFARDKSIEETVDPNIQQIDNKEECEDALQFLTEGDVSFCYYTGVLILEASNEKEIKERVRIVVDTFTSLGILTKVEHLNAFSSLLSTLPGDKANNPRCFLISTDNASSYMSLSRLYEGYIENEFLKSKTGVSSPLLYGYCLDGSPYFLNLNTKGDDVGHTLVAGATGSGKSFLLSLLASAWTKYPTSRVIIFDKGLSSYPLVKGNNGRIIIPGKDKTTFNPLYDIKNRQAQGLNFLEAILSVNGSPNLTAEERALITDALSRLSDIGNNANLSSFQTLLRATHHSHPLAYILDKYTSGAYGNLFNNTEDHFIKDSTERLTLIELGTLMNMGDEVITPSLVYMFDRLTTLLEDDYPTLLILDECWLFLMNKIFRQYIISLLKTMRKHNVFVVLATQEIADVKMDETALSSILSQTTTRIYLADKRALLDDNISQNYSSLGLSDYQKEILTKMKRKKHYYITSSDGESVVDFKAESIALSLTFSKEMLQNNEDNE